jgi:hypothetical protein
MKRMQWLLQSFINPLSIRIPLWDPDRLPARARCRW